MRAIKMILAVPLCLPLLAGSVMAADYYVDDDAAPGGDGQSWESAFVHLQDAFVAAAVSEGGGATIHIAQGTYRPDQDSGNPDGSTDREDSFILFHGLVVLGGYAGIGADDPDARDPSTFVTVLSGDLEQNDGKGDISDNSYHVLVADDTDLSSLISGLVIEAGNANGFDASSDRGGGLFGNNVSLRVSNCLFRNNTGGGPLDSTAGGGAIHWAWGELVVRACRFEENWSYGRGGGLHASNATLSTIDCVFMDNEATGKQGDGGAVAITDGAGQFTRCVFDDNNAWFGGGAICVALGEVLVDNSLIVGNAAVAGGGVSVKFGGASSVVNTTIVKNTSAVGGSGIDAMNGTDAELFNVIVWDNRGSSTPMSGPIKAAYCNIEGGWEGSANKNEDPLFASPETGDYSLRADSPCIDAGNNWAVPLDTGDEDNDDIVFELSPFDLAGNPRFSDDPSVGDSGCGVDITVDMGSYERQFDSRDMIFGDVTGDSIVDVADLLILLGAWGSDDEQQHCLVDFDLDNDVDQLDLAILLAYWGTP